MAKQTKTDAGKPPKHCCDCGAVLKVRTSMRCRKCHTAKQKRGFEGFWARDKWLKRKGLKPI